MDNDAPTSPEENKAPESGQGGLVGFWQELKRRKVVRVAVTYAVVGWLVIQVASSAFPGLNIPDWGFSFILMLVVLGFPVALILAWAFQLTAEGIKVDSEVRTGGSIADTKGHKLNYVTLGLVVLVLTFLVVDRYVFTRKSSSLKEGGSLAFDDSLSVPVRFALTFTKDQFPPVGWGTLLALSPDGQQLAYIIEENSVRRLFVRPVGEIDARLVSDEDPFQPFFSADGEWIFYSIGLNGTKLRKVPAKGGSAQDVATLDGGLRGADWTTDGILIVGGIEGTGLQRVDESGTVHTLTTPIPGWGHAYPQVLPTGRILYTSHEGKPDTGVLEVLDPETNHVKELRQGVAGRYLETGHLLYTREETLWITAFDIQSLETIGTPVPFVEGLRVEGGSAVQIAIANDSSIAYFPSAAAVEKRNLVWVSPDDGKETPVSVPPQEWVAPRVSPNGKAIASDARDWDRDIFIMDAEGSNLRQLMRDPDWNVAPVWSLDGTRVAFTVMVEGYANVYWQSASGTGVPEALTESSNRNYMPRTFTPDGKWLLITDSIAPFDIDALRVVDAHLRPLWKTPSINERNPAVSPDGRWLAYESDQSGRYEIWISPFPEVDLGGGRMVSSGGGKQPVWLPVPGKLELFYWTEDEGTATLWGGTMIGERSEDLQYTPTPVISGPYVSEVHGRRSYDVAPDGRFLMMKTYAPEGSTKQSEIIWWHKPDWSKFVDVEAAR